MKLGKILILPLLIISMFSCKPVKDNLSYFQGADSIPKGVQPFLEPTIQSGDILYIGVAAYDPLSAQSFNQTNVSVEGAGNAAPVLGYLVDQSGNIQFPQLGVIHVRDLRKAAVADIIKQRLTSYLKDPIVTIRIINFKISVLGEVTSPGVYPITNERVSLIQALGMAGDLTVFAKRENVLLIRQDDSGKTTLTRVDLTKPDIFGKDYYWLQQNDVLYVEATNKKLKNADQVEFRNYSLGVSVLTALIVLINTLKR